jgi:hypothetical protein
MTRKRKPTAKMAFDAGLSSSKAIVSTGEQFLPLVMAPEAIERNSESLDRYRCQVGSDLVDRSFVGVNGVYVVVGSLAAALGAFQTFKPLKSETIVYKILAMVSVMAQRLNLGTSFDLELGCLLPPGEFLDREKIHQSLTLALLDFDTPMGALSVNLVRCDFYPEGMGVVTLQQANKRQTFGTGITLMAGHRNLTLYITKSSAILGIETCDLGFNQWVKAVRAETYDYDLSGLSTVMANYWNGKDEQALHPLLRHKIAQPRQSELERLIGAIARTHDDYCKSIFRWLDEYLPDRLDELMITGGVGDVLQTELFGYFHDRMNPHPNYQGKGAIFKSTSFNLPILDVPAEYQSRMADVYCLWKYLMPPTVTKAKPKAKT